MLDTYLDSTPQSLSPNFEPSVQIRNLNFHYGEGDLFKQVLFDINLEIYPGQIVILTGPSGSGKTTLLTLIGALRTIQDGSLKVLGQELKGLSPKKLVQIRKNIGFIFQAHNLFHSLTARQNVMMSTDLFTHPSLILADEPTAALDKKSGRDVVTLMQKMAKEENITILMVTHDNRILDVADRIINLVDGNLESDNVMNDFLANRDASGVDSRTFML